MAKNEKIHFCIRKKLKTIKNTIMWPENPRIFDWNYTFFHVSDHCEVFEGYENYEFDLGKAFPPDFPNDCTGWFDGIIPDYKVKFSQNGPPPPPAAVNNSAATAKKESIAQVKQQQRTRKF